LSDNKPTRLPLIATADNRAQNPTKDARLINGFTEKSVTGDIYCYKRPGVNSFTIPSTPGAIGRGVYHWNTIIYSVFNGSFFGRTTLLGAVNNTGMYHFVPSMGASPVLFFKNDFHAYVVSAGGVLTTVVDGDYPIETVPGAVYIDGTIYVMTPSGHIFGSELNAPLDWDPLNVILAQIESDGGVALAKQQNYLIAFKQHSVEVFYDAANAAGSPLQRIEAAKLSVGCSAAESVVDASGVLIWLSASNQGQFNIWKMEGLKASQISTAPVERILLTVDRSAVRGLTFQAGGHTFYCLNLGGLGSAINGEYTLVYDLEEKEWFLWQDTSGDCWNYVDSISDDVSTYLQGRTSGKLSTPDSESYSDDGVLFTFDLYTPNFDGGTRLKKTCNLMEIAADQVTGNYLNCYYSDDDYQTWSNVRTFDLGLERPLLPEWGTFRRRAHRFSHRLDKPLRIKAADLHIDLGTL